MVTAFKVKVRSDLHNRIGGGAPGFERAEIEYRLDLDKPAQIAGRLRLAAGQREPGKSCRPSRESGFHRVGGHRHGPDEIAKLDVPPRYAQECQRERIERSSKRRIACQSADEIVSPAQAIHGLFDLLNRQEQQSILLEEAAASRLAHGTELFGMHPQGVG